MAESNKETTHTLYIVDEQFKSTRYGGGSTWVKHLASYLDKLSVSYKLLSLADSGISEPIRNFFLGIPNIREITLFPYAFRRMRHQFLPTDTVLLNSTFSLLYSKKKDLKFRTVTYTHCVLSKQIENYIGKVGIKYSILFNRFVLSIFKYLESISLRKSDLVITPKNSLKTYLVEELSVSPDSIEVIPQSVDTSVFKILPNTPKEYLGVFVGRASAGKGFPAILDLMTQTQEKILVISKLDPPPDLPPNCEWRTDIDHGNIDELVLHLNKSRFFIIPSLSETGPIVSLEAMACGLPVICSPMGSGDFVIDGKNGYVLDPFDPAEALKKMTSLLDNKNSYSQMSKDNVERVRSNFNSDNIFPEIIGAILGSTP